MTIIATIPRHYHHSFLSQGELYTYREVIKDEKKETCKQVGKKVKERKEKKSPRKMLSFLASIIINAKNTLIGFFTETPFDGAQTKIAAPVRRSGRFQSTITSLQVIPIFASHSIYLH